MGTSKLLSGERQPSGLDKIWKRVAGRTQQARSLNAANVQLKDGVRVDLRTTRETNKHDRYAGDRSRVSSASSHGTVEVEQISLEIPVFASRLRDVIVYVFQSVDGEDLGGSGSSSC